MKDNNSEIYKDTHYSPVEGNSNLARDNYSNGIVNINELEYKNYIETYKKKYNEIQKIKSMESEITNIKNDLSEIKNLLKGFLIDK